MHEAVLADQMDKYFPGDVLERHEWVERYYERYDDLRTIGPRACRMNVGATASLARDLYFDSGGMDTSLKLGEDISLGYRLGEAGAVFLPDREARSWHLGRTHVMKRRAEVNDYNDCFLSDRLPELRNKRRAGRLYAVPYLEVVLDTTGLPYGSVVATVDAVLGGTLPDLTVTLVGRWSELDDSRIHPLDDPMLDTRLISASYAGDPRVQLVEALPEGRCPAMFRMTLENAEWAPTHKTVARLLHNMERTHHGLRLVRMPDGSTARIERTAAVSRAHRVIKSGEFLDDVLDELFGAWTFEAAEVGFWPCQEVHRAADAGHRRRGRGPGDGVGPHRRPARARKPARTAKAEAKAAASRAGPHRPGRRPRRRSRAGPPCRPAPPRRGAAGAPVTARDVRITTPRWSRVRPWSRRPKRRVVFVVGSGRSGTSTMSGALQTLGMHVPQPEVVADETNPKGFGEPQWVVDLHTELLQRCNVAVSDARPAAWFEAGKLANIERLRTRLHTWLEEQFAEADPEGARARRQGPAAVLVPRACGGRRRCAARPRRRT